MPEEKILVIDDQRSHLRLLKRILERYGCSAITVDSAEEAELILKWNHDFQALITDLKMPWMDGVKFCKRTKTKYPNMKIYALSGNLDDYDPSVLDEAGFDGIYQKPVKLKMVEDILDAIEKSAFEDH